MITRRHLLHAMCGCSAAGLVTGCAGGDLEPVAPGYRPALDSEEGGLWRLMDEAEEEIKYSRFRIYDQPINAYLSDIACRLGGTLCPDVRIYLTRVPYFNASMAPNGMMQIWSGLLLRVTNEAQLAAVIGHEIGHYSERHTVERWRAAKNSLTVANILGLGLAVVGGGALAQLPGIAAIAGILAYSREQEREADSIGLELMTKAGYAPIAAADVWANLIAESKADPEHEERDVFFATHPQPAEREKTLRREASEIAPTDATLGETDYLNQALALRDRLLDDEISLRQPERSLVVIARLREQGPDDGVLAFYHGEVYRLRRDQGDIDRALGHYQDASHMDNAPPQTWRALGLIYRDRGRKSDAGDAFRTYLQHDPNAPDAELIESYVREL